MPKLKKASFSVVEIADVSPLQRIEDLSMHYAEVKNIDSLKQLKQLQKLFIYRYSGATDVSQLLERLQNSTRMKEIHVIDNEVTNLQPLGQMKNLEVLQLVIDNPLHDQTVKPLAGLRNLKALMDGTAAIHDEADLAESETEPSQKLGRIVAQCTERRLCPQRLYVLVDESTAGKSQCQNEAGAGHFGQKRHPGGDRRER
ncbi:hypothetical protein [Brevibacillus sp. HD1.4A]|uniref:hypothetical protein n=1 Tax=Brevibacillus sp. HD1.4A TaxID=2738978 RepID=UPI00156ACEE5|nr:hypothetical protein [Brevibacillus sp. HD1.4A]NRQ55017.1 hypothetical protein [Brevibacillus sp. HD1.4A]